MSWPEFIAGFAVGQAIAVVAILLLVGSRMKGDGR